MQSFLSFLSKTLVPEIASKVIARKNNLPNKVEALNAISKEIHSTAHTFYRAGEFFDDAHVASHDGGVVTDGMKFSQWESHVAKELFNLNEFGPDCITSCWEGLLKTQIMARLFNTDHPNFRPQYRGQVDFDWSLISSFGRKNQITDQMKENLFEVTEQELDGLRKFQEGVENDKLLQDEIFEGRSMMDMDDPSWWAVMQHYDQSSESVGTRMLDLTSSIFVGLYFACADWDGSVDEATDGKLYFWTDAPGRSELDERDGVDGDIEARTDYNEKVGETVCDYYKILVFEDIPRFREPQYRTPRVLSQYGSFIWQPRYWEPITRGQRFRFRIPGCRKKKILRELFAMGYDPERIVFGAQARTLAHKNAMGALSE